MLRILNYPDISIPGSRKTFCSMHWYLKGKNIKGESKLNIKKCILIQVFFFKLSNEKDLIPINLSTNRLTVFACSLTAALVGAQIVDDGGVGGYFSRDIDPQFRVYLQLCLTSLNNGSQRFFCPNQIIHYLWAMGKKDLSFIPKKKCFLIINYYQSFLIKRMTLLTNSNQCMKHEAWFVVNTWMSITHESSETENPMSGTSLQPWKATLASTVVLHFWKAWTSVMFLGVGHVKSWPNNNFFLYSFKITGNAKKYYSKKDFFNHIWFQNDTSPLIT